MRTSKAKRKRIKALFEELKILVRQKVEMQAPIVEEKVVVTDHLPKEPDPTPIIDSSPKPLPPLLLADGWSKPDSGPRPASLEGLSKMDIEIAYLDGAFDGDEEALKWCRRRF